MYRMSQETLNKLEKSQSRKTGLMKEISWLTLSHNEKISAVIKQISHGYNTANAFGLSANNKEW